MSSPALSAFAQHDFGQSDVQPRPTQNAKDPDRIRPYTARAINRAIDTQTDRSITRHAALSDQRIYERIHDLDQE